MSTPHVYYDAACCMTMSVLLAHACVHAVSMSMLQPRPFCMFISALHDYVSVLHVHAVSKLHVYAACPCSMSMLHVHAARPCFNIHVVFLAVYPCCKSKLHAMHHVMLHIYVAYPFCMSMLHFCCISTLNIPTCDMSILHVHAACLYPCCMFMSMLHVRTCQCCMSSPCCMSMTMLYVHVDAAFP
jgi:hypothetical protein